LSAYFLFFTLIDESVSITAFLLQVASSCFVPVLLGHAIDDDFINPHHSDCIFEAYMVIIGHIYAKI
jgi:hypothetical protein